MDLQTFIQEKYEPLLAKVNTLEKTLKTERDERERLLNKLCELEDNIEHLNDIVKKIQNKELEDEKRDRAMLVQRGVTEEPWLFYCKTGRSLAQIAKALTKQVDKAIELHCEKWRHETDMWNEFLKKVDVNSYNVNFEPKSLEDLRKQSINAIYTAYSNNTLLVVRGLPSDTKHFELAMAPLSELCETISSFFAKLDEDDQNIAGGIAMVIESSRQLDVLSIDKEDSKICLYLEQLL